MTKTLTGFPNTEPKQLDGELHNEETQQRRISLQLEAERQRLVNTQAVAKVGSWETDMSTGDVTWSQETHKIFETSSETFRPNHEAFMLAVHPEDRSSVQAAFLGSATHPAVNSVEHRVLLADGRIKFVEERWQMSSDVDGRHLRAIGTCRDITDSKLTENALRQSNEKFLQLAENITDVFWIRSPDMSELQYVSPAFEQIWGAPARTLYANPAGWTDYVLPADRDRVRKAYSDLTACAATIDVQYSIMRPDGGIRALRTRGFQVRDADNKLIRLIGIVTDITEQERTAEALKASMGEFRALTESMPQMVWIARPDGSNIYFNQQWTDYTGLTMDESHREGWNRSLHPDDGRAASEAWQQAIDTERTCSLEARLRGADGSYRWWLIRAVPVRNDHGEVLKWFGTCTDIHDLKVAQLEITRANRALKMLSACSESVMRAENEVQLLNELCRIAVDNGGYRMAWVGFAENDEARSIRPMAHAGIEDGYLTAVGCTWNENDPLGRGPTGEVIRTGRSIVSQDFGEDSSLAPWSAPAQQRGYRGVIRLPLRDGDRTFGLLGLYSAEADQTAADEMRLLQEIADTAAFGITSLRAESERCRMQSSVMEQAALLDTARDAIQVVGLDGRIIYWNKGAERIYGWTSDEVLRGIPIESRFRDPERFREARALLLNRGEWEGEMIKRTRAGRDITVEERWTLVRDESGQPKSILTINTDVTEKKRLESQLMVSDRMASVGTLAAGMAHEINNPLAAVIANLEYVAEAVGHQYGKDGQEDEIEGKTMGVGILTGIKEPLEDARDAAHRVRLIVRDLKIFSRSPGEEGTGPVDVKAVIESSLGLAWNEIRHRAQLVKDYGDIPPVEANEGRLGQVFVNLVVNAAQSIPEGRAEHNVIRVTTRLRGDRVITSVTDSGQGIPQEIIGRIFDPFFTTKPVGVGTGLGLAICRRIVTDMGGELTVESDAGKGATFHVSLPVALTRERQQAPSVEKGAIHGRRGRILVVDDEPMLVSIVTRILSREHDVVSTLVAPDALAFLTNGEKFDLILCDLMMPDMTGMDLHRELLTVAPDQANRMIFVTGGAFTEKARKFLTNPPKEHIEKPFDTSNLLAIVRRHLQSIT